jgi:hypothetical protein
MHTQPNRFGRKRQHRVGQQRADGHQGQFVPDMHEFAQSGQARAQPASGMKSAEIVGREATRLKHGHRQRIAQRQLLQRRGGGRQPVRAGLGGARQREHDVGLPRQRRTGARRHRHQRDGEAARIGNDALQFLAFAGPGKGQNRIVAGDHAKIAVTGLDGMHEIGRGAGRGQRGRDLRADMTALADACHDDTPGNAGKQLDRLGERRRQTIVQGLRQRAEPFRFYADGSQSGLYGCLGVHASRFGS